MSPPNFEELIETNNNGSKVIPSATASTFPPESSGSRKSLGQKIHLPKMTMIAGRINSPVNRTTSTDSASIGPRERKEPKDAKERADIATTVVAADPAIDGPTRDIVVRIHRHLSPSFWSSSR